MSRGSKGIYTVLITGILAGSLDLAVIGPALPGIMQEFGLESRSLSWVFSVYALFNLITLPVITGLADRYGKRTLLRTALLLFSLASLYTALAPSFWHLLVARAFTGISVSAIFPIAPSMIGDVVVPQRRGRALGLIGATFGIALIAGPLVSGFMLHWFSWNSLFLLTSSLGLVAFLASLAFLPAERHSDGQSLPWRSLLLVALLTGSIALIISGTGWTSDSLTRYTLPAATLIAIVSAFLLNRTEKKGRQRLFPLVVTRNPLAILILLAGIGTGIIQASYIFLPNLLVHTFSLSHSDASFLLLPLVILFTAGNYTAGHSADRWGGIRVLTAGWALVFAGLLSFAWMQSSPVYYLGAVLFGLGLSGLESPSLRYLLLKLPLQGFSTQAQGLLSVFISLGQLSGSALLGSLASDKLSGSYQGAYQWLLTLTIPVAVVLLLLTGKRIKDQTS